MKRAFIPGLIDEAQQQASEEAGNWTVPQQKLKEMCRDARITSYQQGKSHNAWCPIKNNWVSQEARKAGSNGENKLTNTIRLKWHNDRISSHGYYAVFLAIS